MVCVQTQCSCYHNWPGKHSCRNRCSPVWHAAGESEPRRGSFRIFSVQRSCLLPLTGKGRCGIMYHVPWSRLLACLRRILAADYVEGTRAVVHKPHFLSPAETDSSLGALTDWPNRLCSCWTRLHLRTDPTFWIKLHNTATLCGFSDWISHPNGLQRTLANCENYKHSEWSISLRRA